MERHGARNAASQLLKAAVRLVQHASAGADKPRDRRQGREQPFEKAFGLRAQSGGRQFVICVRAQKLGCFLDKSSLGRKAATKQKDAGPASRLKPKAKPICLGLPFHKTAASMIGDDNKAGSCGPGNIDIGKEPLDFGRDQRGQRARQDLGQARSFFGLRPIFATNYGG